VDQLATALRHAYVYAGQYSPFRDRRQGRPHDLGGDRFVVCVQNHDQVGNRARGERLCHLVSPGRSMIAAALLLCGPFVPLLFMGEEWAASTHFPFFSSHQDPHVARATTEGRISEFEAFGWRPDQVPDPQAPATFDAARLRWEEREEAPHARMLGWYRELLRLRRERPELGTGALGAVSLAKGVDWLLLRRQGITLACNWGEDPVILPVRGRVLLGSEPGFQQRDWGLRAPTESAGVLAES
jgi:maltooligosyltrehalose trehalohydrolase